ncbi:MAG TPA: HIT family protein [Phycisphaerae bacterium]|nr:HIT family protein [Phycisphaerae bacterium]
MPIRSMTDQDRARRDEMVLKAEHLKQAGICPACRDFETSDVYPDRTSRTFYEDETFVCMLEAYPRTPGHSIILVKPHYEDLAELPLAVSLRMVPVIHSAIRALKDVLRAEKVYACTMCDGDRNHFHLQLLCRLPAETTRGSKLLVKERGVLCDDREMIDRLRAAMKAHMMDAAARN